MSLVSLKGHVRKEQQHHRLQMGEQARMNISLKSKYIQHLKDDKCDMMFCNCKDLPCVVHKYAWLVRFFPECEYR